MGIKEILYSTIDNYKEYRIISDIAQGNSSDAIRTICNECMPMLEKLEGNKSENWLSFSQAFLHYLLTVGLIPSQRKIVFSSIDVDIVIPDTTTLASSPQDALVIAFPKTNNRQSIEKRVTELVKIQPNKENIWLVLENDVPLDVRVYSIDQNKKVTFSNIMNDIIGFLTNKKHSKLRLFRT